MKLTMLFYDKIQKKLKAKKPLSQILQNKKSIKKNLSHSLTPFKGLLSKLYCPQPNPFEILNLELPKLKKLLKSKFEILMELNLNFLNLN
jgi:hypothetical protein